MALVAKLRLITTLGHLKAARGWPKEQGQTWKNVERRARSHPNMDRDPKSVPGDILSLVARIHHRLPAIQKQQLLRYSEVGAIFLSFSTRRDAKWIKMGSAGGDSQAPRR